MATIPDILAHAGSLRPSAYCQLFYVLSAAAVFAIAAAPESMQRLLTRYGARSSKTPTDAKATGKREEERAGEENGLLLGIVDWVTSVGKVPHSWFAHFYVLSLCCSLFWAAQFATRGGILEALVRSQVSGERQSSMSVEQVILAWVLMTLQGARRLYEYVGIIRPSSSKMWIVHWLLGVSFYFCINISIWIEGSRRYYDTVDFHSLLTINHRRNPILGQEIYRYRGTPIRCHPRCRYVSGFMVHAVQMS